MYTYRVTIVYGSSPEDIERETVWVEAINAYSACLLVGTKIEPARFEELSKSLVDVYAVIETN